VRGWVFALPRSLVEADGFAFKFTRGSWETVEVDGQGRDLENRRLGPVSWPADGGEARLRLELLGFRDQRGSRWAAKSAVASSFSGQGEVFELASKKLGDRRTIRVWLPPGYGEREQRRRRYPVLYMHDGQNCFDVSTSAVGQEWCLDEELSAAIADGQLEPWIVVGIDNIGATRAADYNPSGLDVRGSVGRGSDYLAFLCDELVPEIERRYRVAKGPDRRAIGGSSFGGNISLLALLERPGFFNRALIESPALWVGEGVLIERLKAFRGRLPERIWIAMGAHEYGNPERDQALIQRARELGAALSASESDPAALRRLMIDPEGQHNERFWARHLPTALPLVLGPAPEPR
jgi:predicted alpha/beta superfamily hydrolase